MLFLIARVVLVSLGACCYAIGVFCSVQTAFMVAMVIIDWIALVLSCVFLSRVQEVMVI